MTQAQAISLLAQLPITDENRKMFGALIGMINGLTTSDGTKQFPTTLTIADVNKAISIDGGGNAVLYDALTINNSTLGQWFGQTTSIPVGATTLVVATITNSFDVQVNITKADIINAGPHVSPATPEEFTENFVAYINATHGAKYLATDFGFGIFTLDETSNGTIAATFTSNVAGEFDVIPNNPSTISFEYYDTKPVDGILVGIDALTGNAIVDVTNFVYAKLGANAIVGDLLFFNGDGTARPLVVNDDTLSTVVQGKILEAGNTGDVVACCIAPGVYSTLIQLSLSMASIGNLDHGNVRFVAPLTGNDLTAQLGKPGLKYQTLEAAVAAYNVGELIYVVTSDLNVVGNIAADGVQIYFEGGTINSVSQFLNLDTTAGGTVVTSPIRLMGNAKLVDSDFGGGGFLAIRTNASAEVYLNFKSISVSNNSNGMVLRDGTTYMNVEDFYTCNGRPFRLQDTANLYYTGGGNVSCTFGNGFNSVVYSDGMSWSGKAVIKAKSFIMPTPVNGQHYVRLTVCNGGNLRIELEELADDASGFVTPFLHCASNTNLTVSLSIRNCTMSVRPIYSVADANTTLTLYDTEGTIGGTTQTAGLVKWKRVDVDTVGTISCTGTGKIVMDNVKIDSRATVIDTVTLAATSISKMKDTLLMCEGTKNTINNPLGADVTCMSVYGNIAFTDVINPVGNYTFNVLFTD